MSVPARLAAIPLLLACAVAAAANPAAAVRGRVLDPDGRPAPGIQVLLARDTAPDVATITDDEGRFALDGLDPGRYELRVMADGFHAEPAPVALEEGAARDLTVRLRVSPVSEAVVVSASHVPRPRSGVGDSVSVLTAADLAVRQIDEVAGALRLVPGLPVARSGGPGGVTSAFPRGGESNYTLVLIDGVRVNDLGGGFDLAHLGTAAVDRLEIVRGPQSALFGSDAIGGVIQMVTARGGSPRGSVRYEHGRFDTRRVAAEAAGSAGRWSWGAGGDRTSTDGFTGTAPATGERVSNDDYTRTSLSATAGFDTRRDRATLVARWNRDERGFPGPFGSDPNDTFPGVDRVSRGDNEAYSIGLAASRAWTSRTQTRVQVSRAARDSGFVSPFGRSFSDNGLTSLRVQADYIAAPGVGVSAGVETELERAGSTFITDDAARPIDVERRATGVFAEVRWSTARTAVSAGLRGEHFRRARLEGNDQAGRPAFSADRRTAVNPKVSATYRVWATDEAWARIRGSAGTGMRPPDAFEIAFTDNPSLAPEWSRSVEAAVELGLAGGRLVTEVAAFSNRYDDLIVTVGQSFQDASLFRTDNISNARSRGLEASIAARATPAVSLRLGYTWLDTAILAVDGAAGEAPGPFEVGDRLLRRPRHGAFLDATYQAGRLATFARVDARGGTLDVDPSLGQFGGTFEAPGYAVAALGASVRLHASVELLARVTNLFDREYEEILGFPARGRSVTAGVRMGLGAGR